jgi:hypothetical protein
LSRCVAAGCVSLILLSSAHAQTQVQPRTVSDPQNLINWYYSATFGTGVYTSGDRTVSVLQVPYSHALKTVADDGTGLKFKVATTLGFYDYSFSNVTNGDIPSSVSTLSVLPGLEWEYPLTPRWTVRPFWDVGYGQDLQGHESAWIYDFGLKSRFVFAQDRGVEFALANALVTAGYRSRGGPTNPFGYLATGLDVTVPTQGSLFGRPVSLGITPIYYYYFNRLEFPQFTDPENRIREEVEIAFSILTPNPWSLKFLDFDRVGIAVRNSGNITGVSIFTSLPF